MSEKYYLPVLYTEEERKKYAELSLIHILPTYWKRIQRKMFG